MDPLNYTADMLVDGADPILLADVLVACSPAIRTSDRVIALTRFKLATREFMRGIAHVARGAFEEQEDVQRAIDYFATYMPGVVRVDRVTPLICDFWIVPTRISDPMES